MTRIAKDLGVSRMTVYRELKAALTHKKNFQIFLKILYSVEKIHFSL